MVSEQAGLMGFELHITDWKREPEALTISLEWKDVDAVPDGCKVRIPVCTIICPYCYGDGDCRRCQGEGELSWIDPAAVAQDRMALQAAGMWLKDNKHHALAQKPPSLEALPDDYLPPWAKSGAYVPPARKS